MGQPCNLASDKYFADDVSHPLPLNGGILGNEMACIPACSSFKSRSSSNLRPHFLFQQIDI